MEKTAKSAAMRETRKEICKLRVQSTPKEIENFHRDVVIKGEDDYE